MNNIVSFKGIGQVIRIFFEKDSTGDQVKIFDPRKEPNKIPDKILFIRKTWWLKSVKKLYCGSFTTPGNNCVDIFVNEKSQIEFAVNADSCLDDSFYRFDIDGCKNEEKQCIEKLNDERKKRIEDRKKYFEELKECFGEYTANKICEKLKGSGLILRAFSLLKHRPDAERIVNTGDKTDTETFFNFISLLADMKPRLVGNSKQKKEAEKLYENYRKQPWSGGETTIAAKLNDQKIKELTHW